jgi:PhnB protein
MQVNPYLNFPGTCEEAFNSYKAIFGGEFTYIGRFKDAPPQEGVKMTPEAGEKIMHVSMPLGKNATLMGSDAGGEWSPAVVGGNNFYLSLSVETRAEADRIFNALSQGGKISMPLADTFWGDYFGMCTDKFSVNWMMSYNAKAHQG